ncbi:uncharacterized protein CTHT_0052300 [Thermochaetoides thermophila DSM 1495]|uniref:Uncharacterized protein n=1 Tax=Chaetomium thermophilum (strain DSM 1495 / CBS 144.50 / IMI 039719) TaxID=759272 RepID=G0SDM4_CHATD|nr:hypothetical protein CTHT_0052300 [Thermochaetoides thermophila DSM 1495]EGS18625.1 hypothetical protein CTHT_0052300 [Thermochaetoides thermophila DSM 1495]
MPAISNSIVVRDAVSHLAKRSNWAAREPGVVLVFCIVFIVGCLLIALWIHKFIKARRERRAQGGSQEMMADRHTI